MSTTIELNDTRVKYFSIAEAQQMSGLRLVLGNYAIPGPWREACKSIFQIKGIPYTAVVTGNAGAPDAAMGMHGTQSELREWTGQSSQPVAIWNDERPRASWIDQLNLAERLQAAPALIPQDINARMLMFGLINEIAGEYGLGWLKRVLTVHGQLRNLSGDHEARKFFEFMGGKYGYTQEIALAAPARIALILKTLDQQLSSQQRAGRRYLIGDALSALDVHWAVHCGFLNPLPPEQCPMASAFRHPDIYGNADPVIAAALSPALLAHRDFIYTEHLELPVVF
jgi:glutathione S-transferase